MIKEIKELFPGVFQIDKKIATKNLTPGFTVYGERTVNVEGEEYRFWEPFRSKLAAAIKKGLKEIPIKEGSSVLYLGAATGTTTSHVSDIIGEKGVVYCIEFAPRAMRDLLKVCEKRENMVPIFGDARKPEEYKKYITERVDCIYEDIAQPDQIRILLLNSQFLKKGGYAMIAIKSQSIDVTKKPSEIYKNELEKIKGEFEIIQKLELEPYEKDHLFVSLARI